MSLAYEWKQMRALRDEDGYAWGIARYDADLDAVVIMAPANKRCIVLDQGCGVEIRPATTYRWEPHP